MNFPADIFHDSYLRVRVFFVELSMTPFGRVSRAANRAGAFINGVPLAVLNRRRRDVDKLAGHAFAP